MARIFLIDDELATLELVAEMLRTAGHTVTTSSNGWAALKEFRPGVHHLVITDVLMPYVGGIDLLRVFRREVPWLPVIAISGGLASDGGAMRKEILELGVSAILKKPFNAAELAQAVDKALAPRDKPAK